MHSTTSSEFVDWITFLDRLEVRRSKIDYYGALIASEVRRFVAKDPNAIQMEDFLLEFGEGVESTPTRELSREERIARSKAFWCGVVGAKRE